MTESLRCSPLNLMDRRPRLLDWQILVTSGPLSVSYANTTVPKPLLRYDPTIQPAVRASATTGAYIA